LPAFYKFARNVFSLVLIGGLAAQKVGEEKQAENEEHDKEFHKYNEPQGTSQGHASKAFYIEIPDVEQCILHNTGFITSQN
jgi:hypothetical protein